MWHIDTTVIRVHDGPRVYLHAVIDNFSRRILAWRVAETFAPVNCVAVLVEASRAAAPSDTAGRGGGCWRGERERSGRRIGPHGCPAPAAGVHGAEVLELDDRSVVALPEHQWLFLDPLDSVTTVRRLVAFYVDEHNRVLPHSAFRGQTPDEMYFGTGDAVPADLALRAGPWGA
jgi:putative transposase